MNKLFRNHLNNRLFHALGASKVKLALILLLACGCKPEDSASPTYPVSASEQGQESASAKDRLASLLVQIETGGLDQAAQAFAEGPTNGLIGSTDLQEFLISENDFAKLPQSEKSRLQTKMIERVGQLKNLCRHVVGLAEQANAVGDEQLANDLLSKVQSLGRELKSGKRALVLQQLGNALANASLEN